MKPKTTFSQRYRYWFDNIMSKGAAAVILWLGIISLLIVFVAGAIITVAGIAPEEAENLNFFEASWQSLMRTFDAGTMGGDQGWGFRWVMLFVTLGGIFIVSALIGIINNAISNKIDDLRKGRSMVVESNHTLILGWSSKIFSIISELIIANQNVKKPRIVIMADKDKVEMEDEIASKIPSAGKTKIICRSGNIIDMDELNIVNPQGARSVIILAPENDDPDIHVIKSVLAITNNPERKKEKYHIVSEIRDIKNLQVAEMVGRDETTFILNKDIISRMIVQTSRQSGMSVVFTELLDFDGDEIYFHEEPALTGKTFREAMFLYEKSSIIGIHDANNVSKINPPMDTLIKQGDKLIAISEDDDTVVMSKNTDLKIDPDAITQGTPVVPASEKTLILGWNEEGTNIVKELDNYVTAGSYVRVVANIPESKAASFLQLLKPGLRHQTIDFISGNTSDRELIDALNIPDYDHIIVLSYTENYEPQESDAITLVTLLHLRDIAEKTSKCFNIVSEMMDVKNRELASVTNADDFIVSDKIISLLLSQLSENKYLKPVFDDLFDADGSEIYIKPVSNYVTPGTEVNFYTVTEAAARRNEVAIGYRKFNYTGNADKAYGVVVNPLKSEKIIFDEKDKIIVIAED